MSWSPTGIFTRGPREPLRHRCASCTTTQASLLRCTGCRLVRYCGWEHQVQHRPQHKWLCKKIARFRDKVQQEEHRIRNAVPGFLTPANAFETHAGRFGDMLHTRDYMLTRFAVADLAVSCGMLDGAVEALGLFRDMVRLDRSDILGLRELIPALMLRLDLDQECYDFVKWWETCGADRHYDWADMSQPFLSVADADVLEEPVFLLRKKSSLNFQSAVLLLKLKLLVDIRNLKVVRKVVRNRLPVELWALVERDVIRSPLSARYVGRVDLEDIEDTLMHQCYYLGIHSCHSNRHFMCALLKPTQELLSIRPDSYPKGSPEEAVLALQTGYVSWWETVGALDLLQEVYAHANLDWQHEVKPGHPPGHLAPDCETQAFCIFRMWEHLDCVVKESSYLGPAEDAHGETLLHIMESDINALWAGNLAEE